MDGAFGVKLHVTLWSRKNPANTESLFTDKKLPGKGWVFSPYSVIKEPV